MVKEEKVKIMTAAALAQQRQKRDTFLAVNFYGDDYVSFQAIKAVIGVTFSYALLLAIWALGRLDALLTQYSLPDLFALAKEVLVLYLLLLLVTVFLSVLVYTSRYWRARENMKAYQANLKKLHRFYRKEEKERKE